MSLSDDYGLNTELASMQNVSDFVDDWNNIQSYTPTVMINAGSVALNSIAFAEYVKIGKLIFINVSVDVTLSGSPGGFLSVSIPFTARSGAYRLINAVYGQGTTFYRASGILTASQIDIVKEASAAHTTGTWQLYFSGFYYTT